MAKNLFTVRVWGARGSIPVPGKSTVKYGGNTTCVEVRAGEELIILDAGSGIRPLGDSLMKEGPISARIFFTHLHWDHIQGLPFFTPAYLPGNKFDLFAERKKDLSLEEIISGQMIYPYFPVTIGEMQAALSFAELEHGDSVQFNGVTVKSFSVNHPGGCLGYRIEYKKKAFVFATDTEHFACVDPVLVRACKKADLLIYDATYTDDEYCGRTTSGRTGWGHSTWTEAIKLADAAGVGRLALTHHDPSHDDAFMAGIEKEAAKKRPGTVCVREGMEFDLLNL